MAEPTALRLHDNQPFRDQLGHAVYKLKAQTKAHLTIQKNTEEHKDKDATREFDYAPSQCRNS
eukprot:scaffold1048_cov59-Attheya_sp.AAC.5